MGLAKSGLAKVGQGLGQSWCWPKMVRHDGQTSFWPLLETPGQEGARQVRPDAVVWRGDPHLPANQQDLTVLGVPIASLNSSLTSWRQRAENIPPCLNVSQGSRTLRLLSCSSCADQRGPTWLRTVKPELTEGFAERHDAPVWRCLSNILGTPQAPDGAQVIATLALSAG